MSQVPRSLTSGLEIQPIQRPPQLNHKTKSAAAPDAWASSLGTKSPGPEPSPALPHRSLDYSQHLLSSFLTPRFGELHSIYRSRSCGETIFPLNFAEPHDSKSVIFITFGGESASFWTKYAENHFLFSSRLPISIFENSKGLRN